MQRRHSSRVRLGVAGKWQFYTVGWPGLTEGRLGKDLKEVS